VIVEVTVRVVPDDGNDGTVIAVSTVAESVVQGYDLEENLLRTKARVSELSERTRDGVLAQLDAHVAAAAQAPAASSSTRPIGRRPR
jgi:ribosomal protein L12E/L44/L45/RPP1/RPP2